MMLCQRTHIELIWRACVLGFDPGVSSHRGELRLWSLFPSNTSQGPSHSALGWFSLKQRDREGDICTSEGHSLSSSIHWGGGTRGHRGTGFSQAVVTLWDIYFWAHSVWAQLVSEGCSAGWSGSGRIILWEAAITKWCIRIDWIGDLDGYVRLLGSLALSLH